MRKCNRCGELLENDDLFCHECGTKIEVEEDADQVEETIAPPEKKCIHCGNSIEADSEFCPFCGNTQSVEEMKATESKQVEDPGLEESRETYGPETPNDQVTDERKNEKKSKKWVWILILFLLVVGGMWFYLNDSDSLSNVQAKGDIDSVSVINEIEKEDINEEVEDEIINAEDLLKKMYEEFFEPYNTNRFEKDLLSKYFSEGVLSKFYVEDYYSGKYFYCTDFLVNGCISGGGEPDYGNKVVKRTIENKGDGWYEVTNLWDVIKTPVKVRLKVDNIGSKFFISDFVIIKNEQESTNAKDETFDEAEMMNNLAKRNLEANGLDGDGE